MKDGKGRVGNSFGPLFFFLFSADSWEKKRREEEHAMNKRFEDAAETGGTDIFDSHLSQAKMMKKWCLEVEDEESSAQKWGKKEIKRRKEDGNGGESNDDDDHMTQSSDNYVLELKTITFSFASNPRGSHSSLPHFVPLYPPSSFLWDISSFIISIMISLSLFHLFLPLWLLPSSDSTSHLLSPIPVFPFILLGVYSC